MPMGFLLGDENVLVLGSDEQLNLLKTLNYVLEKGEFYGIWINLKTILKEKNMSGGLNTCEGQISKRH